MAARAADIRAGREDTNLRLALTRPSEAADRFFIAGDNAFNSVPWCRRALDTLEAHPALLGPNIEAVLENCFSLLAKDGLASEAAALRARVPALTGHSPHQAP